MADRMAGVEDSVTGVDGPTPRVIGAHLVALNLTGLSFAVKRLLGKDPQPVAAQFTMWARKDRRALPSLTAAYWKALAPLGTARPGHPAAAVCDLVLRGREGDSDLALKAAVDCASAGKASFHPLPTGSPAEDDGDAVRRDELVALVKDYWRGLGIAYGDVRGLVVAGDLDGATARLAKAQRVLGTLVERIAVLAAAVAAQMPAAAAAAEPDAAHLDAAQWAPSSAEDDLEAVYAEPDPAGQVADPVEARAEAFAQQRPLREDPDPAPSRPVEVLSTKPVRNHVFLPIVFLLVVAGVALYVIFSILNAPNPLAS